MRDRDIDEILQQAARAGGDVDPAILAGISQSIRADLRPARALAPGWILTSGMLLVCAAVALAVAGPLKLYGLHKLSGIETAVTLPVLTLLMVLAAVVSLAESIPGSRRVMPPWLLVASCSGALAAMIAILFHDYQTERFVTQGLKCLALGLLTAVPASIGVWLVLRRGAILNLHSAGLARGTLAGLAGVAMLQLHCPNFETFHLLVWHLAIVPLSAVAGMWILTLRGAKINPAGYSRSAKS